MDTSQHAADMQQFAEGDVEQNPQQVQQALQQPGPQQEVEEQMQHEQEQVALPQQAQRADCLLSPLPLNLLGLPFVTEAAKQAALAALGPGASPEHLTVQGLTELGLLQQGEPAAEQSPEYTSGDADLQIWLQEQYDQQALYNAAQLYAQGLLGGQARRPVQPQQRQSPQRSPPPLRQQRQPVSPQWPPIVLPVQQRGQVGSAAWVDAAVQQSFRQHSGGGFPYQVGTCLLLQPARISGIVLRCKAHWQAGGAHGWPVTVVRRLPLKDADMLPLHNLPSVCLYVHRATPPPRALAAPASLQRPPR